MAVKGRNSLYRDNIEGRKRVYSENITILKYSSQELSEV
jgi:hypothetical protein